MDSVFTAADFELRGLITANRTAHRLIDFAVRIPLYWQDAPHPTESAYEQARQRAVLDQIEAIKPQCPHRCPYFNPSRVYELENHVRRTMHGYHVIMPDVFDGSPPPHLYNIPNLFNTAPLEQLLGNTPHGIVNSARTYLESKTRGAPPAKLPFEPTEPVEDESLEGLLADIDQLTKGEPPDENSA